MHNREEAVEEYLEAAFRLKEKEVPITISSLASSLKVSPPSASEMARKLRQSGLVSSHRYGEIFLTKKGEEIGRRMVRKHRLAERFLSFLGIKRGLHREACKLEHAVSDSVERKMQEAMGGEGLSLANMGRGVRANIVSIKAEPAAERRLKELGLTKGTEITLSQKAPFRGAVEIVVRGTRLAIGRKLALRIIARQVR